MTLPFPIDNSFQSNFNFYTSNIYDGTTTSNYVDNVSNLLNTKINTKQDTLVAGTNLLGVGSAISALDYNKITLNKPTNFQSDWNSTIINKPSTFPADMTTIYTKTETNNLLNAKEAVLTFSSPLTRTTNTIGINLSSYSTTGNDANYLLKSALPTNFWIKTADNIDRIYFNNGGTTFFHSGNTNGAGFTFRSTAQTDIMTLTDAGALTATSFSGNGASLTNLAYANITGKPTNFQADWNSTIINKPTYFTPDPSLYYNQTQVNNISNYNSNFTTQQSNILNTNINTKQNILTGATSLLGNGSALTSLTYGNINGVPNMNLYTPFSALLQSNYVPFTALLSSNYTSNSTISLTNYLLKSGGTLTGDVNIEKANPIVSIKSSAENQTSILYLSTPLSVSSGLKCAIISQGLSAWGRSKLHFCLNDNQTDNSTAQNASVSHARMTILPTGNIGINNTAPSEKLDVNGNIKGTAFYGDGANITNVPFSTITGKPTNFQSDWNTTIINKPSTFPADMTTIYTKTETNTLLNAKEAILTFSSPLTRTTNTIGINLGSYSTTGTDPNFLKLIGGTMTGQLILSTTTGNNPLYITSTSTTANNCINIKNNSTYNGYIGIGGTALTGNYANNLFIESASGAIIFNTNGRTSSSVPNMIVASTGNIGINNTSPSEKLEVNGNIKVSVNNRIRIEGGSGTNALSIGGYGSFQMDAPGVVGGRFSIDDSGNVSIGGYTYAGGTSTGIRINGNDYGNTFYQNATTINGQPANIGFTLRDANTFNFNSFSSGGAYTTLLSMNTSMINLNKDTKINGYLGVGITNPSTNPLCKLDVQGIANIRGVSPYAVPANYMAAGSLCIGSTDVDYGYNTGWSANTAGIMMECANITEICVHDAGTRVASLLYYYGSTNQIYIGRDKGWGRSSVFMDGYLQCLFFTVDYVGYDKVGVADTIGTGRNESRQMYQIWNSFTDFHRCFVDDELFNKDKPQEFKDIYMGRIVVSTGVIKTHSSKHL